MLRRRRSILNVSLNLRTKNVEGRKLDNPLSVLTSNREIYFEEIAKNSLREQRVVLRTYMINFIERTFFINRPAFNLNIILLNWLTRIVLSQKVDGIAVDSVKQERSLLFSFVDWTPLRTPALAPFRRTREL